MCVSKIIELLYSYALFKAFEMEKTFLHMKHKQCIWFITWRKEKIELRNFFSILMRKIREDYKRNYGPQNFLSEVLLPSCLLSFLFKSPQLSGDSFGGAGRDKFSLDYNFLLLFTPLMDKPNKGKYF